MTTTVTYRNYDSAGVPEESRQFTGVKDVRSVVDPCSEGDAVIVTYHDGRDGTILANASLVSVDDAVAGASASD